MLQLGNFHKQINIHCEMNGDKNDDYLNLTCVFLSMIGNRFKAPILLVQTSPYRIPLVQSHQFFNTVHSPFRVQALRARVNSFVGNIAKSPLTARCGFRCKYSCTISDVKCSTRV